MVRRQEESRSRGAEGEAAVAEAAEQESPLQAACEHRPRPRQPGMGGEDVTAPGPSASLDRVSAEGPAGGSTSTSSLLQAAKEDRETA